MAFWGVQVKPKKPFKFRFEEFERAGLHLTQATLGSKITKERTIVKCKVGDGPAVFLCSLLPGAVETCSLDLYFREDVVFSVKGSTSVHLVGYYGRVADQSEEDSAEDYEDEDSDEDYEDEDSMDDSEDAEFDFDGEDMSDEDLIGLFSTSGVKIEEVLDEDPSEQLNNALNDIDGQNEIVEEAQKKNPNSMRFRYKDLADGHSSSSEDQDGFVLTRKRKPEEADEELSVKRRSPDVPLPEPSSVQDDQEKTRVAEKSPMVTKKVQKKKKKKKKKDDKVSLEHQEIPPVRQGNGLMEIPSTQGAGETNPKGDLHNAKAVDGEVRSSGKKGFSRKYPNGLEIENVSIGEPDGKQAKPGKKVGMCYIGKLKANGKIFDSNIGRKAFEFRLGVGEVIKGWDVGVNGMRVGDKRQLTIPPAMGYGQKGVPGIPPNSWLVFTVELMHVK